MPEHSYTCPECEEAEMEEDDHVYICPRCGYETADLDEEDED